MASTATLATPASEQRQRPSLPRLLFWMAPLIPLGLLSLLPFGIIDDAYISFRYARNLALGHGFVFNPHEHVEGVTNLLWTVLLAGFWKTGIPLPAAAAALGFVFGLLAVREAWRSCTALDVPSWAAMAATLPLLLSAVFWLTVTNGLEGGLSAYLLARLGRAVIENQRTMSVGIVGGLLFLTRFDTLFAFPVYVTYVLVLLKDRPRAGAGRAIWRDLLVRWDVVTWASVIGAITLFRLAYFGSVIPNSVLAKRVPLEPVTLAGNAVVGTAYCVLFVLWTFPICVGLLQRLGLRPSIFVQAIVGVEMAIVLWNGGDWMPHYRLLAVYEPLCVPLTAQLFANVPRSLAGSVVKRSSVVIAIFLAAILYIAVFRGGEVFSAPHLAAVRTEPCMDTIGHALARAVRPGDRVASEAIGIFSYDLPNTYSSDLDGLTDRTIATRGTLYIRPIGRMDAAYTFNVVRPTVIVARFHFHVVSVLAAASRGRYNRVYSTFEVRHSGACTGFDPVISIQKNQTYRFLPALSGFGLAHTEVP